MSSTIMVIVRRQNIQLGFAQIPPLLGGPPLPLKHVADVHANLVHLAKPLEGHDFWEETGVSTSLGQIVDHVFDEWPAVQVIVLVAGSVLQQLVGKPRDVLAVKLLPTLAHAKLNLCVVLLALRVLSDAAQVVVVVVVLLYESLPVLVRVQPLSLLRLRDWRIVERDEKRSGTVANQMLRRLNRLCAALDSVVEELPAIGLGLDCGGVILRLHSFQDLHLFCVKVLDACHNFLVGDLILPFGPIHCTRSDRGSRNAGHLGVTHASLAK
mmetsp:Transcript_3151/g.7084  ORF Transcript_3151/g.7084 Transcript_3151/m.7084 type:complete len:268 (-) Transcript_3151:164-967(-)